MQVRSETELKSKEAEMSANTFTPGPAPNTVRAADGRILTAPEGWVLLPPGEAALTRGVKADGDHWAVQEKKGINKLINLAWRITWVG